MGNDQIIIRIHKHPEANQVILSFPFAAEIVAAVKMIPGRRHILKTSEWRIPFYVEFNYR